MKCESGTGSFVGGAALDGYFFRLTQVAYISISVYCMSDFENENDVKIENGRVPGEWEQKWFGENTHNCVKQEV